MHSRLTELLNSASSIILGKDRVIRLAVTCLLARGHLLVEDQPGVGKTTLSHMLATLFGLDFNRIQFTSDILPTDIVGTSVYNRETGEFHFHPGPVFTQVVLADEINRATPRAQSALLEAMEERQVTVDNETRELPEPFFVIATQNPASHIGTFPLPESQLDRFLMRISIGYPDTDSEKQLLMGEDRRETLKHIEPVITAQELLQMQLHVRKVQASEALVDYIQAIISYTRDHDRYQTGLSPRAGLALLNCARAWAMLSGRDMVLPEDVQAVLPAVACHRLLSEYHGEQDYDAIANDLVNNVAIP